VNAHAVPALFVLGVWWLSTGIVLGMVWLRASTHRLSLGAVSALALAGLVGLAWSSQVATSAGAYLAFSSALAVWGWHELTFLLGVVTGPRKEPCPPDARGWRRFALATATVIHHELAMALTLVGVIAITWGAPNQVGAWTFLVMWIMRLSAKFNVFLGVRNLSEEFIPDHLRYLPSYFRRARMNPLMPFSLILASAVAVRLAAEALSLEATPFVLVGRTLVATILALAVVEHVFLALPVPDALLWRWAIRPRPVPTTVPLTDLGGGGS
jgi:putative photosynthetic complex assembly protein 2